MTQQTNTNNDINNDDSMIDKHLSRHNYSTIFSHQILTTGCWERLDKLSITIFGQGSKRHHTGMTARKLSIVFLAYSSKHACSQNYIYTAYYSQPDCVILFIALSNKAWMSILSWCFFLRCLFRGLSCTVPFFVFINDINIYCYSIMRTT